MAGELSDRGDTATSKHVIAALMTGVLMASVSLLAAALVVRLAGVPERYGLALLWMLTSAGAFVGSWLVQPAVSRWVDLAPLHPPRHTSRARAASERRPGP